MNIRPDRVRSRRENWRIERLGQLRRGHPGVAGPLTRLDGPIVVVEYGGIVRLLDGNHRINTWVANGGSALHAVHVHAIEGTAEFVVLPALQNFGGG
jgi:hypothetical protein